MKGLYEAIYVAAVAIGLLVAVGFWFGVGLYLGIKTTSLF